MCWRARSPARDEGEGGGGLVRVGVLTARGEGEGEAGGAHRDSGGVAKRVGGLDVDGAATRQRGRGGGPHAHDDAAVRRRVEEGVGQLGPALVGVGRGWGQGRVKVRLRVTVKVEW